MHDNSWFIEVVPINILSCHRQHINSIRHGWHFCSQFSLLNYFNVWINKYSGLCMPILRSLNLYIWWFLAIIWLYLFTVWQDEWFAIWSFSGCWLKGYQTSVSRKYVFLKRCFSMVLLWQWDFQGSVMSCNSKALEPYPCSDSQKHPLTCIVSVCTSNRSPPGMVCPPSFKILDWTCYHRTPLCQIYSLN